MHVDILFDGPLSPPAAGPGACAFPSAARLPDGTIAVVYRQGSTKHSHDGVLVIQTSDDAGRSWSAPRRVFDGLRQQPPQAMGTAGICALPDGTLLVSFFTVEGLLAGMSQFTAEGLGLPRRVALTRSRNGGQTWSEPLSIVVSEFPMAAVTARPFLLPNGEIGLPIECYSADLRISTALIFSDDGGQTWSEPLVVHRSDGPLDMGDARFCALPDGRLLMLQWAFTHLGEETVEVQRCTSTDLGRTWTPPASAGFVGQVTVPSALPGGSVIAVSNARHPPEGIRLWFSPDGGASWDTTRSVLLWDARRRRMAGQSLDLSDSGTAAGYEPVWGALEGFSFGTPDLLDLGDGTFFLTYYALIEEAFQVRACRFRLAL